MIGKPIVWLALAGLVAFTGAGLGQEASSPPTPDRKPLEAAAAEEKPELPGDAPTVAWTDAEVAGAEAACKKLLTGIPLDYEPLPPIKEGLCGTPAPILIKSIGADPEVAIEPPATVTCALAARLNGWLKDKVQPAAKAQFGAAVVKIRNASSYVCRNRYGDTDTLISEHALANALDVSEFVFSSGKSITVLDSWPRIAAETAVPPKDSAAEKPVAIPVKHVIQIEPARLAPVNAPDKPLTNPFVARPNSKTNPFVAPVSASQVALPMPPPEAKPPAPPEQTLAARRAAFVKTMHAEACKVFGTVLGPEANEAHKDHFHLDMKARRHSSYCE